ncbi:hypothetical protein H4582DRAFT_1092000 [Lactarius indigo]|nr:hypothetical protein H4582DRAFT_1092000 [Lactarius indigo]
MAAVSRVSIHELSHAPVRFACQETRCSTQHGLHVTLFIRPSPGVLPQHNGGESIIPWYRTFVCVIVTVCSTRCSTRRLPDLGCVIAATQRGVMSCSYYRALTAFPSFPLPCVSGAHVDPIYTPDIVSNSHRTFIALSRARHPHLPLVLSECLTCTP